MKSFSSKSKKSRSQDPNKNFLQNMSFIAIFPFADVDKFYHLEAIRETLRPTETASKSNTDSMGRLSK